MAILSTGGSDNSPHSTCDILPHRNLGLRPNRAHLRQLRPIGGSSRRGHGAVNYILFYSIWAKMAVYPGGLSVISAVRHLEAISHSRSRGSPRRPRHLRG